jgi:hypothetical protein
VTVLGLADAGRDPLTDGILDGIQSAAAELGHEARLVSSPRDEASVDVLITVGAPRSYAAFLDEPPKARRIAWFGEPLPRPGIARRTTSPATGSRTKTAAFRAARAIAGPVTRQELPGPIGRWRERAGFAHEQLSNLNDAVWCGSRVDRVVVTSRDRGSVLREHGLEPEVVPFGYDAATYGPLTPPEGSNSDIAVAVIGSGIEMSRLRRGRVLQRLAPSLRKLGKVEFLDGVWGADRAALLRRTRCVLDISRIPGNFVGLRFILALSAGCAPVTEPLDDPHPFRPGVDHAVAPVDEIVDTIARLLANEPARSQMVCAGQELLRNELSMRRSLERVLAQ